MRFVVLILAAMTAAPVSADTVIAARTLRAQSIIGPADVTLAKGDVVGTYRTLDEVLGLESRGVLYAGRPVRIEDLGPPAIIDRNQVVPVIYNSGTMRIMAEGRALGRAGAGDMLRVMNLASHAVISGRVLEDGTVTVSPPGRAFSATRMTN
ncbi:MAG: flagella basal body P-ring formation protein FlgA [Maritimibacter sp.]|nr:flagella basal body P-ring formation protein FlgA [Maritimibacter sp.]